jgi:DNA-binding PadR family transcriptional regulator
MKYQGNTMRHPIHDAIRGAFHGRHRCGPDRADFARGPFGKGGFGGDFGRGFGEGFPGPGGPGGLRGRGGKRRRLFDQAELQSLLLALIAEQPRHGYELIKEIETLTGGEYAPSPGIVYPALTFMEEQGVIAAIGAEGSRKAYEATEEGRKQVEAQAEIVAALRERLTALAEARDKTDPAPVRRAMHSMKTATFDRLSADGVSRETILAIAEIIDEAARKIERIEP